MFRYHTSFAERISAIRLIDIVVRNAITIVVTVIVILLAMGAGYGIGRHSPVTLTEWPPPCEYGGWIVVEDGKVTDVACIVRVDPW